jgi:hypothetical protein
MDPMLQSEAREWLMMLTMWAFFGYALYLITVTLRRKQRNAMQQHVLDKFASAKDFADFVQSPAGQKYVMSFADTATSSKSAILNSVRTGVALLTGGVCVREFRQRIALASADRHCAWLSGNRLPDFRSNFILAGQKIPARGKGVAPLVADVTLRYLTMDESLELGLATPLAGTRFILRYSF